MTQDELIVDKARELLFKNTENADMGIDVRVEKGFVTLSGIVDILSEKEYAEKVIRSIPGVRGVDNSLTISTDGNIKDEAINETLAKRLSHDPRLKDTDVGAVTKHGAVYLMGHAKTLAETDAAWELASSILGVKEIISRIEIGKDLDLPHDDASLVNRVEAAFAASHEVEAEDVKTECEDHVIYLEGTVDDQNQKEAASGIASTVAGVRKVVNHLSTRH